MFLNRLFAPDGLSTSEVQIYNKLVKDLTDGLVDAQKQFVSSDRWKSETWISVGDPWTVLVPTDGTHCEIIQSASHAFSELSERKAIAGITLIEEQAAAIAAENVIRGNVDRPIEGKVTVGKVTDY